MTILGGSQSPSLASAPAQQTEAHQVIGVPFRLIFNDASERWERESITAGTADCNSASSVRVYVATVAANLTHELETIAHQGGFQSDGRLNS